MNQETYQYSISGDFMQFEFYSDGPKGKIRKVVQFVHRDFEGISFFNLSFADYRSQTGELDDQARSDNKDRDKILATIAATVLEFNKHFPGALVYAEGSTSARTRLYQMGITSNLDKIREILYVYGQRPDEIWEPFRKNTRYIAFLVKSK